MISVDLKKTDSIVPSLTKLSTPDEEPKLSFSELLKGLSSKSDEKIIQNGSIVIDLQTPKIKLQNNSKDTQDLKSINTPNTKENFLSLLKNDLSKSEELKEILEINPKLSDSLSINDVKKLIADAKIYLKDKITQTDGYKNSEIKELPKTLSGLISVAKKFDLDISKINFFEVKSKGYESSNIKDILKTPIAIFNEVQSDKKVAVQEVSQTTATTTKPLETMLRLSTQRKQESVEIPKDMKNQVKPENVEIPRVSHPITRDRIKDMKNQVKPESVEIPKDMKNQVKPESVEIPKDVKNQVKPESAEIPKDVKNQVKPESAEIQKDVKNQVKPESIEIPKDLKNQVKPESIEIPKDLKNQVRLENVEIPRVSNPITRDRIKDLRTNKKLQQNSITTQAPVLIKAQTKTEHTTQEIVQIKQFSPKGLATNGKNDETPQKVKETLKSLLHGEKIAKETGLTADFSVNSAKVIAPSVTQITKSELTKGLESLLGTQQNESSPNTENLEVKVRTQEALQVTLKESKQMIQYLSSDVKTAIEDYKSPFTRIKLQLNPQQLGEVDLTVVQRGKNLHVNIGSNNTAVNTLAMNINELRVQLSNSGINNATFNFNNSPQQSDSNAGGQQQNNSQERQQARREYDYFEKEDSNEEILNSLEIVVPNYA